MIRRFVLLVAVAATAACNGTQLGLAQIPNTVDTVTLGSLSNAALRFGSALDVTTGQVVRTDENPSFDFIYTVDSLGRHTFLPLHAIAGLGVVTGSNPGFSKQTVPFDQVITAPGDPWLTTDTIVVAVGDVYAVRSRVACYLAVPQYGKIHVLSFDDSLHTVSLEILSDANCGYKNLQPGIPQN